MCTIASDAHRRPVVAEVSQRILGWHLEAPPHLHCSPCYQLHTFDRRRGHGAALRNPSCLTIDAAWRRWPVVAEVSRKVLGWRLKALPYLYSAFYDSHTFGCPIARPLWFVFPTDATTLRLHEQWMMGEPCLPTSIAKKVLA